MKILMSVPISLYFADCDREIEVWANITGYRKGRPAYISGPPEDCYPEEYPEVDYYLSWNEDGPESIFLDWIMKELHRKGFDEYDNVLKQYQEYFYDEC
jgi:hypothetical protein